MRKILRAILGFLLLIIGLVLSLPGVPGPGIAIILLGLVILSDHFHWARRAVDWMKRKAEKAREKAQRLRGSKPQA